MLHLLLVHWGGNIVPSTKIQSLSGPFPLCFQLQVINLFVTCNWKQKFKLFPKFMKVRGHSRLILNVTDANALNSSSISNEGDTCAV